MFAIWPQLAEPRGSEKDPGWLPAPREIDAPAVLPNRRQTVLASLSAVSPSDGFAPHHVMAMLYSRSSVFNRDSDGWAMGTEEEPAVEEESTISTKR